jgi:hypothetical protein
MMVGTQQVHYVDQSTPAESKVSLRVEDRSELAGNAEETDGFRSRQQAEEPPTGGRWAAQRAEEACLD